MILKFPQKFVERPTGRAGGWQIRRRADSNSGRYLALVPEPKARDFADPYAYNLALSVFLTTSFIAYFLICQLSPDVFAGAVKLFAGDFDVNKAMQGIPSLVCRSPFMGLTQSIFPGLSRIKDVQRNFFHEQIVVPGRVADLFTNVTETIEERAAGDKKRLAEEVRKLAGNGFLKALSAHGDVAFYKAQLDRLGIGNGALELVLRARSTKELHVLIEQLVMHALMAAMRRSGLGGYGGACEISRRPSRRSKGQRVERHSRAVGRRRRAFLHRIVDDRFRTSMAWRAGQLSAQQGA